MFNPRRRKRVRREVVGAQLTAAFLRTLNGQVLQTRAARLLMAVCESADLLARRKRGRARLLPQGDHVRPLFQSGQMTYEPPNINVHSILDALLTGASMEELQPRINALLATERATLLCSTCAMIDELAVICREVSLEAESVLICNCRFFEPGNGLYHAKCDGAQPEPPRRE